MCFTTCLCTTSPTRRVTSSQLNTWRTVGWSKFNKSDLPNTMVEPKSSWATRTQPLKTQYYGPGPDVTRRRTCGCVCPYKNAINSFWLFSLCSMISRSNSCTAAFISRLTSFRWLIMKWVAAVSPLFTQRIWDAFVSSFKLSHHRRKETTAWFSEEMINCRRQMFTVESAGRKL